MKRITSLFILAAAALFAGCSTTSPHHASAGGASGDFVATVSCGDPSMRFTGTIVQDGHSTEVSGVGSGTFYASGHQIVFTFKKTDADGQISFSVTKGGKCLGCSSTSSKFGGVRGEISHHLITTKECFTTI